MSVRNYPEINGCFVYVIKTPDNMYYPGYSGQKRICDRWRPKDYKSTSLNPYIMRFGWETLEKIVLVDGLTEDEALDLEDRLICIYRSIGRCINKRRSGHRTKQQQMYEYNHSEKGIECRSRYQQSDKGKKTIYEHRHSENFKEYQKTYNHQYRTTHREEILEKQKEYYQKNKEELSLKKRIYYKNHKEKWLTPEKIIYRRVAIYNRNHTPIETPLEAKNKYLEYGYIPSYIKNNDLV